MRGYGSMRAAQNEAARVQQGGWRLVFQHVVRPFDGIAQGPDNRREIRTQFAPLLGEFSTGKSVRIVTMPSEMDMGVAVRVLDEADIRRPHRGGLAVEQPAEKSPIYVAREQRHVMPDLIRRDVAHRCEAVACINPRRQSHVTGRRVVGNRDGVCSAK